MYEKESDFPGLVDYYLQNPEISRAKIVAAQKITADRLSSAASARRFKERIRVNGLAVACGQYDESVERRVIDAVCFLAQTPVVSGQILRFDGACPGEKKK